MSDRPFTPPPSSPPPPPPPIDSNHSTSDNGDMFMRLPPPVSALGLADPGPGPSTHLHRTREREVVHRSTPPLIQPTPDRHFLPSSQQLSQSHMTATADHHHHSYTYTPDYFDSPQASSSRSPISVSSSTITAPPSDTDADPSSRRDSNSTNPTTAPSSPLVPTTHRVWRPTGNVPAHIARRHRPVGAAAARDRDRDGGEAGNRWLSEDEGSGSSGVIGRRRRRGSGGGIGHSSHTAGGRGGGGSSGSAAGPGPSGASHGMVRAGSRERERLKADLSIPKLNALRLRHHAQQAQAHAQAQEHNGGHGQVISNRTRPDILRRRSSPPHLMTTTTTAAGSTSSSSSPSPSVSNVGTGSFALPKIGDLVPSPNPVGGARVIRPQRVVPDIGSSTSGMAGLSSGEPDPDQAESIAQTEEDMDVFPSVPIFDSTAHTDDGDRLMHSEERPMIKLAKEIGGGMASAPSASASTSTSTGAIGDGGESERKKVWRAGLLGQLHKLLTW